jgi:hypothetical protein
MRVFAGCVPDRVVCPGGIPGQAPASAGRLFATNIAQFARCFLAQNDRWGCYH